MNEQTNNGTQNIGTAVLTSILAILSFLFVWPWKTWIKSVNKVAQAKMENQLDLSHIDSLWPVLSYLKRFFLEFMFDATIVLGYIIGIIVAFAALIIGFKSGVATAFGAFFGTLIAFYYMPIYIAIFRDLVQLFFIAPIRKFISWLSKPAQYIDINAGVKADVNSQNK